ncbi:MAG: hypothetical protein ACR2GP_08540, partial [Burkholderiaceae bacterium]
SRKILFLSGPESGTGSLSRGILASIGTKEGKLESKLYEELLGSSAIRDISWWNLRLSPRHVLASDSFDACLAALGQRVFVNPQDAQFIAQGGQIGPGRLESDRTDYLRLRERLRTVLREANVSEAEYLGSWQPNA